METDPDVLTEGEIDAAHEADEAAGQATADTVGPREMAEDERLDAEVGDSGGVGIPDDRTPEEKAHDKEEGRFEA